MVVPGCPQRGESLFFLCAVGDSVKKGSYRRAWKHDRLHKCRGVHCLPIGPGFDRAVESSSRMAVRRRRWRLTVKRGEGRRVFGELEREPRPGTWIAVEVQVSFPANLDLVAGHELAEGASLDHGGPLIDTDETDSSARSAPSGTRERSSHSASDRRQPMAWMRADALATLFWRVKTHTRSLKLRVAVQV